MKHFRHILMASLLIGGLAVLCGCASSREAAAGSSASAKTDNSSIAVVSEEDATRFENVYEFIINKFPAIYVQRTGASYSVRIRGVNSINGNNEPLYYVDDVPVRDLMGVNMADVQSVEILKGGRAMKYGMQSGNGVILVKTRR